MLKLYWESSTGYSLFLQVDYHKKCFLFVKLSYEQMDKYIIDCENYTSKLGKDDAIQVKYREDIKYYANLLEENRFRRIHYKNDVTAKM